MVLVFAIGMLAQCGGRDENVLPPHTASPTQERTAPATPSPTEKEPVDSDGDGVADDLDDYPDDPSRHSADDRDGDGVPNGADAAPDDPTISAWPTGVVSRVVDGDTIDVVGSGRIRLIGIDTPEVGQCGFQASKDLMEWLVEGETVTLIPGARDDRDIYDRLLRYVEVDGGRDVGREMIASGWAIARYDSRDGYGAHPREADYIALDARVPNNTCSSPAPVPAPARASDCDLSYPTVCIPPHPPDLDCGEVSYRRFTVLAPDPHGFDRDRDGIGCESG